MKRKSITTIVGRLRRRFHQEEAATTTEYAVMLALILMTCIGAIRVYGGGLQGLFVSIQSTLFTA